MQQSIGGGVFANYGKGYVERACGSTNSLQQELVSKGFVTKETTTKHWKCK
jgi:hypothetical protein